MISLINFTDMSLREAFMVLRWRNDINIRSEMLNNSIISIEQHFKFLEQLILYTSPEKKQYFLVCEFPGDMFYAIQMYKNYIEYIGVIDFYGDLSSNSLNAWWGYYANPLLLGKGYGILLEKYVLDYAFNTLKVNKLWCETLITNDRVWKMHSVFGFKRENDIPPEENDTILQYITKEEKENVEQNLLKGIV